MQTSIFVKFPYSLLMSTCIFIQVKSVKTQPIVYGKVVQFLLYGSHSGDVFATGGEVEVALVCLT